MTALIKRNEIIIVYMTQVVFTKDEVSDITRCLITKLSDYMDYIGTAVVIIYSELLPRRERT